MREETNAHSSYFVIGLRESTQFEVVQLVAKRCSAELEDETYPEEQANCATHIPGGAPPGGSTRWLVGALALLAVGERRLQS